MSGSSEETLQHQESETAAHVMLTNSEEQPAMANTITKSIIEHSFIGAHWPCLKTTMGLTRDHRNRT